MKGLCSEGSVVNEFSLGDLGVSDMYVNSPKGKRDSKVELNIHSVSPNPISESKSLPEWILRDDLLPLYRDRYKAVNVRSEKGFKVRVYKSGATRIQVANSKKYEDMIPPHLVGMTSAPKDINLYLSELHPAMIKYLMDKCRGDFKSAPSVISDFVIHMLSPSKRRDPNKGRWFTTYIRENYADPMDYTRWILHTLQYFYMSYKRAEAIKNSRFLTISETDFDATSNKGNRALSLDVMIGNSLGVTGKVGVMVSSKYSSTLTDGFASDPEASFIVREFISRMVEYSMQPKWVGDVLDFSQELYQVVLDRLLGFTLREISDRYGISLSEIAKWMKKLRSIFIAYMDGLDYNSVVV